MRLANSPCGPCGSDTLHVGLKCQVCGHITPLKRSFGEIVKGLVADQTKGHLVVALDRVSRKTQHEYLTRRKAAIGRQNARNRTKSK
jgi:hypothetical protein